MILLIDNYDSFVYNLFQYVAEITQTLNIHSDIRVIRNDAIGLRDVLEMKPSHIIISPGPSTPLEAGICLELIPQVIPHIPLLGICLGHQAIAQALGGEVIPAPEIVHGKASAIEHDQKGVFASIPQNIQVGRYHSLCVDPESLPDTLTQTAWSSNGVLQGIRHVEFPWVSGLQFHPESILTEFGTVMLRNFLHQKALV